MAGKEWKGKLPEVPDPVANYVTFRRSGALAFTSGVVPMVQGELAYRGRLGKELSLEEGYQAARTCALLALSILQDKLDSLERVANIQQMTVYVNSDAGFSEQHKVADGATDVLVEVLGDRGKPARSAVGVAALPLESPVEISLVAEVLR